MHSQPSRLRRAVMLAALTALPSAAQAMLMEYTDQASFLAAIESSYLFDDFDGESGQTSTVTGGPENGYEYSAEASTDDLFFANVTGNADNPALSTFSAGPTIEITFTGAPVTAVGGFFFPTDIGGNVITGTITLDFNGGGSDSLLNPGVSTFSGFTSTVPLAGLSIDTQACASTSCYPALDNFYVGAAATTSDAPVPATAALLALGVVGIGLRRAATLSGQGQDQGRLPG